MTKPDKEISEQELKETYKRLIMTEGWQYWQVADDLLRRVDCGLMLHDEAREIFNAIIEDYRWVK